MRKLIVGILIVLLANSPAQPSNAIAQSNPASEFSASAGVNHMCAVATGGVVQCWGGNEMGQIALKTSQFSEFPSPVEGIENAVQVDVSQWGGCAVLATGRVNCWGPNFHGDLGDGTRHKSITPVEVLVIRDAKKVAVSANSACALTKTGVVYCWGDGVNGQLGNNAMCDSGSTSPNSCDYLQPTAVQELSSVVDIQSGDKFTCALISSGSVDCWGWGDAGQQGNGTVFSDYIPNPVTGLTGATAISAGGSTACAVLKTGKIQCWGDGFQGRLGDGNDTGYGDRQLPFSPIPREVGRITDAIGVSVGSQSSCAVRQTGEVSCWGSNGKMQLGANALQYANLPVTVPGISNASQVFVGGIFACALVKSGLMLCWGTNSEGEFGNGTYESSPNPISSRFVRQKVLIKTPKPTISGVSKVGQWLTANLGIWDEGAETTCLWLRDGVPIEGEGFDTYLLSADDYGHKISVEVTGSSAQYLSSKQTGNSVNVKLGLMPASPFSIVGLPKVNQTLSANSIPWAPRAKILYEWLLDGKKIQNASTSTIQVVSRFVGHKVAVRVTQKARGYIDATMLSSTLLIRK